MASRLVNTFLKEVLLLLCCAVFVAGVLSRLPAAENAGAHIHLSHVCGVSEFHVIPACAHLLILGGERFI